MTKILWKPDKERILNSNMMSLYKKIFKGCDKDNESFDYNLLHEWSLENVDNFWEFVWNDAGLIGDKEGPVIDQYNDLFRSKFFPESQINFAENLLKGDPNREAIVFYGEAKEKQSLTLLELKSKVFSLAIWLKENGVGVGDRVAALLPNCPETIMSMLASSSIGAVFTSCSPDFGEEGIIDRFGQSKPKVFITCDGYTYAGKKFDIREKSKNISKKILSIQKTVNVQYLNSEVIEEENIWEDIIKAKTNESFVFEKLPFNSPLYILYSSGTTGKPKCIIHSAGGTLIQHI